MGSSSPLSLANCKASTICGIKCVPVTKLILWAPCALSSKKISTKRVIEMTLPTLLVAIERF